jgi:hypothetical protein
MDARARPITRAMGSHARDLAVRPALGAIGLAAALLVVLLALACVALAAAAEPASAPASTRSMTDAQLADEAARLSDEATSIGERLLHADARRSELAAERDAARGMLAAFLASQYKRSASSGTLAQQVLTSTNVREAADRLEVADAIAGYHANVLGAIDDAEAGLDVSQVERAALITRLTGVQRRLTAIEEERTRRAAIAAAYRAEREQRAAERAAEAAQAERDRAASDAAAAGTLVGMSGAASATPMFPPGSTPTAAMLDAYLASKGSPMAGQGAAFVASGMRWQVDPRLLVAIAGAESSFGQVTCGPNNAWGWACPNDPADFATWAAGIDTVTQGLRRYYLDEGRTSVSLIQQKYCPVGAANDPTGLNSHWTGNVTKFLVELGGNPASVGPGPSGPGAIGMPDFGLVAAD